MWALKKKIKYSNEEKITLRTISLKKEDNIKNQATNQWENVIDD